MQELTPHEPLSGIEGAPPKANSQLSGNAVTADDLREDIVIEVSDAEKRLIIDGFPSEKNNCLVVPKVIEE